MTFKWHNQTQHLRGLDTPPIQAASLEEISRKTYRRSSLYVVCLFTIKPTGTTTSKPELQKLLDEFSGLFEEPDRLPPVRKIEHRIKLNKWKSGKPIATHNRANIPFLCESGGRQSY